MCTNDLIKELPKAVCLPLENWNDEEIVSFQTKIKDYKEIVEKYNPSSSKPYPSQGFSTSTSFMPSLPPEEGEILFQTGNGEVKKIRFKLRSLEEIKKRSSKKELCAVG